MKPEEPTPNPDTAAVNEAESTATEAQAAAQNGSGVDEAPTPAAASDSTINQLVTAAQAKAQEYLDGWQRERAEFKNYKARADRDIKDSRQKGSLEVLVGLLPIIDDFERAMSNLPVDLRKHPWLEGITLIQRKFQKMLDDNNVVVLDPVGQAFDPSRHEAIGAEDSTEIASGHVTITLQKGYVCGDRVLRPALVRVAN